MQPCGDFWQFAQSMLKNSIVMHWALTLGLCQGPMHHHDASSLHVMARLESFPKVLSMWGATASNICCTEDLLPCLLSTSQASLRDLLMENIITCLSFSSSFLISPATSKACMSWTANQRPSQQGESLITRTMIASSKACLLDLTVVNCGWLQNEE